MNRMEKAKRLLSWIKEVHLTRESRLEEHVGFGAQHNCSKCHCWKNQGQWLVDHCAEALRLSFRIQKAEKLARLITLLILENVESYR